MLAIRAAANSNLRTREYFTSCEQVDRRLDRWRVSARLARASWRALRQHYALVPVAARTAGQQASWTAADVLVTEANAAELAATPLINDVRSRILTRRIYRTPVPNLKWKEADVPIERRPRRDISFDQAFSAEGLTAGRWRTVLNKELVRARPPGDGLHVEVRVWIQVDAQNRIIDVSWRTLPTKWKIANHMSSAESG